jgi:uncharacterized membrane protein
MKRFHSIDFVRGLVMVIMAIDHTRDLAGNDIVTQGPTNLQTTTVALFFTRWITHLCAPTFAFLSGTSAYISLQNRNNLREGRAFLIKRGFWLVVVNFTVNNFLVFFDIHFGVLFSQIIAAIGFGLIGVGLLLKLPVKAVGLIGVAIIFLHNLADGINFSNLPAVNVIWTILMKAGGFNITRNMLFVISYPIIPWLGIVLAGYGFGSLYHLDPAKRKKLFFRIGLGCIFLFILIRGFNSYGDPAPWSKQPTGLFTFLSFINTTKYPPSLLFILMTLGISILLLSAFDQAQNRITNTISTYGQVPLFFWLLHWFVLHLVAMGIFFGQGFHWQDLHFTGFGMGRPEKGGGLALPGVYTAWACVVIFLYPISWYYGQYKKAHKENTLLHYL